MKLFITKLYNNIINQSIFHTLFFKYCNLRVCINNKIKTAYNNNDIFKNVVNYFNYYTKYLNAVWYRYKIEPNVNNWISIGFLHENKYNEEYNNIILNYEDNFENIVKLYTEWYNICDDLSVPNKLLNNSLIVIKYNNNYIDRICNRPLQNISSIIHFSNDDTIFQEEFRKEEFRQEGSRLCKDFEKSAVRFLSIEYIHEDYDEPIILNIDNGHYLIDNEILSATFIKRLLDYQPLPYIFDMNYTVKIMDNNIKTFILNSNQYVYLDKNDYVVITML